MKILKYFIVAGTVLLLCACGQKKKDEAGVIRGKLVNAPNTVIYLERFDEKSEYAIDSVKTDADGNFSMPNRAAEKDYYVLRTNPLNMIFLLLDGKENVEITGDSKSLEQTYTVKGSEDSELIRELKKHDSRLSDSVNSVYADFRDKHPESKDSAGAALQKYYSMRMESFAKGFIPAHQKSLVSLSVTQFLDQEKDLSLFEQLLATLQKEYPQNKYVKDFETKVADLKKVPVGGIAPDIRLNNPEGKPVSLSSLRGKTVLIDFWASWCGPCRRENPHIVEMYRKFKNKKFEVFGVSLDDNADSWKDAIRKDGLSWTQVSDLKKWDSQAAKDYHIEAIPYSILVDKEGKIVAKGLEGDELEQKLIEIL